VQTEEKLVESGFAIPQHGNSSLAIEDVSYSIFASLPKAGKRLGAS